MDSLTVDAEARPFRVDCAGPHMRIRSDRTSMPVPVVNRPPAHWGSRVLGPPSGMQISLSVRAARRTSCNAPTRNLGLYTR